MINDLTNLETSIETSQLIIRTLKLENISPSYLDWLSDPEINKYLETRHTKYDLSSSLDFVRSNFKCPDNLLMGMYIKETNCHVGNIKLGPVNWHYKRAGVGLMIGEKTQWGKGLATEAIEGIVVFAFEKIGLIRVQAGAYAENISSIKAFQKAGFEIEGVLKSYWFLDEKPCDQVLLGKVQK